MSTEHTSSTKQNVVFVEKCVYRHPAPNPQVIKGSISVISKDPPCKAGNARFTTVDLKALSDQVLNRYQCL